MANIKQKIIFQQSIIWVIHKYPISRTPLVVISYKMKNRKKNFAHTVSGNTAFFTAHYFSMNRQNLDLHAHAPKISVLEFINSALLFLHSFKILWRSFMHSWHDGVPKFFRVFMVSPFHRTLISILSLINLRTSQELEKVLQCCSKWLDRALAPI